MSKIIIRHGTEIRSIRISNLFSYLMDSEKNTEIHGYLHPNGILCVSSEMYNSMKLDQKLVQAFLEIGISERVVHLRAISRSLPAPQPMTWA